MKRIVNKEIEYYMSLPYTIEIVPYKDGGFFARIKELEGCMTEGDTKEEVLELLEDAKRVWLEAALEDDLEIPLPESMRKEKDDSEEISLRLPKSLHRKLVEGAKKEGVNVNTYIVNLLSERNEEKSRYSGETLPDSFVSYVKYGTNYKIIEIMGRNYGKYLRRAGKKI